MAEIAILLKSPEFDMAAALESHRKTLLERNLRTKKLLTTIEKTIRSLKEKKPMLTDEELYQGFSKKEIDAITKEVTEKYDPAVVMESYRNVRALSKERWAEVKKEGEEIAKALASVMDRDPSSREVQRLVARHYAHINVYYKPTIELYRGLGTLYATDARFRAYYDKYADNLADFINKAIAVYCDAAAGA